MISCILPTRGRRQWAEQALQCFNSQTYINKELVIVDDADQPSFPYGVVQDDVRYFRSDFIMPISEKRNYCCQIAVGEWIAHFDSDDWSAPDRLEVQRQLIADKNESVIGFHTMLFWDVINQRAYKYIGKSDYALGTSLMYLKRWWKTNQWPMTRTGLASDNVFVKTANKAGQLVSFDAELTMVARAHLDNSSNRIVNFLHKPPFREINSKELPVDFPK